MKDKRILITGGTSGLGLALATEALERGAKVVAVARRPPQRVPHSDRYLFIAADISHAEDIYAISGEATSFLGSIDILINNASYLGQTPLKQLLDTECEDFEAVLQTNVLGPFRLTKAILPQMVLSNRGLVVNISSDAAVSAYPRWGSYSVSKAALDHLSRVWEEELKLAGIHFLAVDPGDMDTPMHRAALPESDPQTLRTPSDSARLLLDLIESGQYLNPVRRSL